MSSNSRRISEVASWTFASRLLGLLRDVLLFASLGTGPLNSAFILAFTLPNLFRRLLGEGALTSSSIPVLAECREKNGDKDALALLNAVITRLGILLLLLQVIALPLFFFMELVPGLPERWYLGAKLSQILFPYMIFICLGALICGMLNVLGRFGLAAFNQVWLNLAMIGAMLVGLWVYPYEGWGRVILISVGVLAGGVLQFVVPAIGLKKQGWSYSFSMEKHPELSKIMRLFLPGLLGAAIFQINILVSRMLAFSLDDTATGLLYISSRLVELPLGVFAIAVTTVVFPQLARMSANDDKAGFSQTYRDGLGLIMMITLPAALGLILLAQPILGFLFQWGLFDARDVLAAQPVLSAAAIGLPFFAWSTLLTRAWYARQQMRTPVVLAAVNLVLNLCLGLILMRYLGATGLALGNAVSSIVHCLLLQLLMPAKVRLGTSLTVILRLGAALIILTAIAIVGTEACSMLQVSGKLRDLLTVALVIPAAMAGYFGFLWLTRYPAMRDFLKGRFA